MIKKLTCGEIFIHLRIIPHKLVLIYVLCKVLIFLSKTSAYLACIRDMYNERWTQDLHRHPVLCIWSWSTLLGLNEIPFINHLSLWWFLFNILGRRNSLLYSLLIVKFLQNWNVYYRHDLKFWFIEIYIVSPNSL
jgi:hypothetical protein